MRLPSPDPDARQHLERLASGKAFVRLAPWTIWRVTGADRAAFFHNFCTAELKKRQSGEGCEGFVLTGQGKVLDFVFFTPLGDVLWIDAFGDRHAIWNEHFDRYRFVEKAKWEDASPETPCLYVSDEAGFEALGVPRDDDGAHPYSARLAAFDDVELVVRRVEWLGRVGWTIFVPRRLEKAVVDRLTSNGFGEATMEDWHRLRVAALFPLAGSDVGEKNLPQESGRIASAISFTKGCYLGQETVARLDMMGHVNWKLSLLEGSFPPGDPPPDLTSAGKAVARFASVADDGERSLALAYVRREKALAGTELSTDVGTFRVKQVAGEEAIPDVNALG